MNIFQLLGKDDPSSETPKYDKVLHDRKKKIKYEISKEQKQTGLEMDNAYKREQRLRNNRELYDINDYSQILYRLPISEEVMAKVFKDLTSKPGCR